MTKPASTIQRDGVRSVFGGGCSRYVSAREMERYPVAIGYV